ncbi:hypothetical protein [Mangrovibacter plantisponsor]|uniref:hypothetical protein n=1 Tax=Mangrovibacter plantisponsor TaxID=451513 RepID=UPI001472D3A4|nr:hypothetical protein [Mangrovibacter plantisponsor]
MKKWTIWSNLSTEREKNEDKLVFKHLQNKTQTKSLKRQKIKRATKILPCQSKS